MQKSILLRYFLFAVLPCLGALTIGAQEPGPQPPPPEVLAPASPAEPNLSPPIPPLDWEPLPPSPPAEEPSAPPLPPALFVPPPQTEPVVPPPPPAGNDSFTPGVPNLQDLEMALPEVEVWRSNGEVPQTPARWHRRFELAYVVEKEPTLVRLRFHPQAAGQGVVVQPGPGVTVYPPDTEFRIEKNGECVVSVALDGSFIRSDFNVYCCGVKTKVPLERASVEAVEAREAAGRSGQ